MLPFMLKITHIQKHTRLYIHMQSITERIHNNLITIVNSRKQNEWLGDRVKEKHSLHILFYLLKF